VSVKRQRRVADTRAMHYVPVDIELQRISPAKLKLALGAALLLVLALDIAEPAVTLG
jgi:hypothetical protein